MTTVIEACQANPDRTVFLCDFSPPRSADPATLDVAGALDVDFICVAYNPGRSVRPTSAMVAAAVRQRTGKEMVFNLATRDMNRLALQSLLLGGRLLGLENVVLLRGDAFTERDLAALKPVYDVTPREAVRSAVALGEGVDFRGLRLREPVRLCVGAATDLSKGIEQEARLAHEKVQAGAQFLIAQAVYDPAEIRGFRAEYERAAGAPLGVPVFYGIQVLARDGLVFGNVPASMRWDLEGGRPPVEIALEVLRGLEAAGVRHVYLIPPILKGGARDYEAAQRFLEAARG